MEPLHELLHALAPGVGGLRAVEPGPPARARLRGALRAPLLVPLRHLAEVHLRELVAEVGEWPAHVALAGPAVRLAERDYGGAQRAAQRGDHAHAYTQLL